MLTSFQAAPDIDVVASNFPIPGYGFVPVTAFVLEGSKQARPLSEPTSCRRCDPSSIQPTSNGSGSAPGAHPFVGPNQVAFEQMLRQMAAPA